MEMIETVGVYMAEQDIVRQYQVYPAIETVKVMIIDRLKVLFDGINILFQNKIQSRKDDEIIALVKSTTISLYLMLKPKIIEYITLKEKTGTVDKMTQELGNTIQRIETSIANPSAMTIEDAIYYADIINIFCHDYGVTRITYFAGTVVPAEKDIYKVV
jgi:hypothetical protein